MILQPFETEITPQEFEELKKVVAAAKDDYDIFSWLYDHHIIALDSEMIEMILIHKMESGLDINHLTDNT
jgi:hypothetical protein